MALYSSNRIASIAAIDEDTTLFTEDNNIRVNDNINPDSSLEEGEEEYNLDNVSINPSYFGLLETVNNIRDNDLNLFNNLLESDFLAVCKENTLNESVSKEENSDKISNIEENITNVVISTIGAIEQTSKRLLEAYNKYDISNQKLLAKYSNINEDTMVGFTGISNFSFPNETKDFISEAIVNNEWLADLVEACKVDIVNATDQHDATESVKTYMAGVSEIKQDLSDCIAAVGTKENWVPSSTDIAFLNNVNSDIIKTTLENTAKDLIENVARLYETDTASLDESELSTFKMNLIYEMTSDACALTLENLNTYKDLFIKEISSIREATIICGKYANKSILDEATTAALIESSDIYVTEFFENNMEGGNK